MSEVLSFDSFSLKAQGPTLSFGLSRGQSLCVIAPPAGGKSRLVEAIKDRARTAQGSISFKGDYVAAGLPDRAKRLTPQALAKKLAPKKSNVASAALSWCGLLSVASKPIVQLSPTHQRLTALLNCFCEPADLILVDGLLDSLGPWSMQGLFEGFRQVRERGACIVVTTNRPDLIPFFDSVLLLKDGSPVFAGTLDDLILRGQPSEIYVESHQQAGPRALVEPFKVSVSEGDGQVTFRAAEGQALAARLLAEGYGDVQFAVLRQPTLDELVQGILSE